MTSFRALGRDRIIPERMAPQHLTEDDAQAAKRAAQGRNQPGQGTKRKEPL